MKTRYLILMAVVALYGTNAWGYSSGNCGKHTNWPHYNPPLYADNCKWTLDDDGRLTVSGTGAVANGPWYADRKSISSISIENGITSIGDQVFTGTSATSISLPNTLNSIGNHAFSSNKNLTSIEIPDSVINIDEGAFAHAESLESIVLGKSVTSLGSFAFCSTKGTIRELVMSADSKLSSETTGGMLAGTCAVSPTTVQKITIQKVYCLGGDADSCKSILENAYIDLSGVHFATAEETAEKLRESPSSYTIDEADILTTDGANNSITWYFK